MSYEEEQRKLLALRQAMESDNENNDAENAKSWNFYMNEEIIELIAIY